MDVIIGIIVLYSTAHFFWLQNKGYKERSRYEQIVSVVGMVGIALVFIGTMTG